MDYLNQKKQQRTIIAQTKTMPHYKIFHKLKSKGYIKKFQLGANDDGRPAMLINLKNDRCKVKAVYADNEDVKYLGEALLMLYFTTLMELMVEDKKIANFVCNKCGDMYESITLPQYCSVKFQM